jgi:hypothetical protein
LRRLEQSLNKPAVVLVVGVVAVALNVLLYFGYFLPRTTPFVEQIYSIGTSLPEAISRSDSESGSQSDPEAGSKSDSGSSGTSGSDGGGGSDSGGSLESVSDPSTASSTASRPDSTSGSNAAGTQPQQQSDVAPQSPDSSPPPELPTLPSPSQQQYQ